MTNELARGLLSILVQEAAPDASVRVELSGELDVATRPALTRALQPIIARGCRRLVLDLGALQFVDGHGLGALLDAARALARQDGVVVLLDATATRPLFEVEDADRL